MTPQEKKDAMLTRLSMLVESGGDLLNRLDKLDVRLTFYIRDVLHASRGEADVHNIDEVAMCCRFLRMARAYDWDVDHVTRFIKMYERFKFSGLKGRQVYKMTPQQVMIAAGLFLFTYVDDLGRRRNATRDAILFIPRKFAKTTFLAALSIDDFCFGDANSEFHIVANSLDQSKIAYKEAKALAMQIDPSGKYIRFTASEFNWREGNPTGRSGKVCCHTGGGKAKDGAFASKVAGDEYGSAVRVKDHCDMSDALQVFESSMGPRLNPLTINTTTAGKVLDGDFEHKLRLFQQELLNELNVGTDERCEVSDQQFLFACHPDEWEYTDECFALPRIHKKCNPHIGITVQPDYYEQQWMKAKGDPETYKETVTKLFNQFVSGTSRPWITAEQIRRLQCNHTLRDLDSTQWVAWLGMDFSKGDDLCTVAYNCYNPSTKKFFYDCAAWIAEEKVHSHPLATLYEQWHAAGHLHYCPGNIIDETMVLDELNEASKHVNIIKIGYDPYDSMRFVNLFQSWLIGKGAFDTKQYLIPVSQTWASFNASCQVMYDLINWPEQRLWVSNNELIPFCFGSAVLTEDKMGNCKPEKRTASGSKIDVAIGLLEGIIMQESSK